MATTETATNRAHDASEVRELLRGTVTEVTDDGAVFVKILVHVSAEEQKRRMLERPEKPHKRYKVGMEDFRNIAKRSAYLEAYHDMLERTDTDYAPWHVIASDNKMRARLKGLQILTDVIGKGMEIPEQTLDPEIEQASRSLWGWKLSSGKTGKAKQKDDGDNE